MEAMNKRLENLTWPDEDKTREQLEAIRELAKELHADYPTDTADEPTNWSNEARNRRNAYIRAQFLKDENGVTLHLLNGSEWLELFDLLGFSVDKETRKRFVSHLKWYSFWYADFKPRLSSKYAQRIHWYVHNFLFCLRNKLQTEKEYREGKYGSKGQVYFMGIEQQPATPAETPRISKETAETVNVSAEGEKATERVGNSLKPTTSEVAQMVKTELAKNKAMRTAWHLEFPDGTECDVRYKLTAVGCDFYEYTETRNGEEAFKDYKATECDITFYICQRLGIDAIEPPQSTETPQMGECTAESCKLAQTA